MIAVPDEENLSVGMRSAAKLLDSLKVQHRLNYKLIINSEPHQRKNFAKGIFSEDSVGKTMPFFYVRGVLAHAGKVFEGLNPLNMDLSDVVGNEVAPPLTWLYLRDGKERYDVSMPLSTKGCLSFLTLNQSPQDVLKKIKENQISMIDGTFQLVEFTYEYIDDISPKVLYGLVPPYYPNVYNLYFDNLEISIKNISKILNDFTEKRI